MNIVSPTEFYIRKPNWEILYNQLGEQMRRDLGKSTSGHNVREKDLLQPGLICAYVNRAEETFKRAMVVASNLKNSKHLQVKLFLVDSGKFLTTTDSNLYYFGKKPINWIESASIHIIYYFEKYQKISLSYL